MKNFFLILLTAFYFDSYSQDVTCGNVQYKILNIDFEPKKIENTYNATSDIMGVAQKQTFQLDFNNLTSKFYIIEPMQSDNLSLKEVSLKKIARIRFTSDSNYYIDKENQFLIKENQNGTLIKRELTEIKWQITKESKQIDNYLCYKAFFVKTYIGRDNKEKNITIEAWFAPALPYSYGPKDYYGLPGLILELKEKETTFYASYINFCTEKMVIEFPKGKTITDMEYKKKVALEGN